MKFSKIVAVVLFALPAANLMGQKDEGPDDGPVGIFQSRAEYYDFMGGAKRAAYGEGGSPELQAMIPMINDIALNKPVGWTANTYNDTGSPLGLLSDSNIRAELEMVDDQYNELKDLRVEIQRRAGEQLRSLDFSDRENVTEQIRSIRDQANSDLSAVLLPHQLERLNQIRMQALLKRKSLVEILTRDPFKSELEITDKQSSQLKDFEKEVQRDLEKEIAKLREKARGRLLSKLDPEQKSRVEEMIGDAFEFRNEDSQKPSKQSRGKKRLGQGKFKGKN